MVVISIDFIFMHAYRFQRRHAVGIVFGAFVYTAVNFTSTKVKGRPVYEMIDYESPIGIIIPIFLNLMAVVLHLGVCWINDLKLKALSYPKVSSDQHRTS